MGGLLRYQIFLGYGILFLAIWYAALSTQKESQEPSIWAVFAPVWLVVALGIYAVSTIVYGVATFKDFPEASAEIEQQVKEAKVEMKKRGVIKE
jgi:hypothetical protein